MKVTQTKTRKKRDYGSPEPGFKCADCQAIKAEKRKAKKKKGTQ